MEKYVLGATYAMCGTIGIETAKLVCYYQKNPATSDKVIKANNGTLSLKL